MPPVSFRTSRVLIRALMLFTLGHVGACKFPYPADVEGDASSAGRVGGTLTGMWQGGVAQLHLVSGAVDETLEVDASGAFQFVGEVGTGSSFEVTVAAAPDRHRCTVEHGSGTVPAAGVVDVAIHCTIDVPLVISASLPFDWTFDRGTTEYTFPISMLVQALTIKVDAPDATTIQVNAMPLASGARSSPVVLAHGDNVVSVAISLGPLSTTYNLRVQRGALPPAQLAYGKASNTEAADGLGNRSGFFAHDSVAVEGEVMVVGAPFEDSARVSMPADNTRMESGAAYVFRRQGARWMPEAYLKAPNADVNDNFGAAVAVSGDLVAIGAWAEASAATTINGDQTSNAAVNAGAVYVFRKVGGTWTFDAYLKAPNAQLADAFGESLALDGNTLVVGAPGESSAIANDQSNNAANRAGAAYVFVRDAVGWRFQGYVKAVVPRGGSAFGSAVDVEGDRLAVGAFAVSSASTTINGDPSNSSAPSAGAAYVFHRSGTTWTQEAYVKAPNAEANDRFGSAVELFGERLLVAAPGEDSAARGVGGNMADNVAQDSGAAYVFSRASGAWQFEAYLKAPNSDAGDELGYLPSRFGAWGDLVALGVKGEDSNATGIGGDQANNSATDSGAVHVFQRTGTTWAPYAYLKSSNSEADDQFGNAVALGADGLAVVAPRESSNATGIGGDQTSNGAPGSGAVYVFR